MDLQSFHSAAAQRRRPRALQQQRPCRPVQLLVLTMQLQRRFRIASRHNQSPAAQSWNIPPSPLARRHAPPLRNGLCAAAAARAAARPLPLVQQLHFERHAQARARGAAGAGGGHMAWVRPKQKGAVMRWHLPTGVCRRRCRCTRRVEGHAMSDRWSGSNGHRAQQHGAADGQLRAMASCKLAAPTSCAASGAAAPAAAGPAAS